MERRPPGTNGPIGRGADAAQAARPGVPRARDPAPDPGAHWERLAQQPGAPALAPGAGLRATTPVFGTAQPARGLSGVVRRAAYRVPGHRASRWTLLVLADRLDVLEHRLARGLWLLPVAAALAAGYVAVSRRLDRA